jgi:hypothetical protein
MNKYLLLLILTVCIGQCLNAQQTVLTDNREFVCLGSSTTITCEYGNSASYNWEVSADGGNSWNPVPVNSVYSFTTNGLGSFFTITPTDLSLNHDIYRCTVTLSRSTYSPSAGDTLYINTTVPPAPLFLSPQTTVCSGSTESYTIIGDYTDDSVYWSTSDYYQDDGGGLNLTTQSMYFSGTYASDKVYATGKNGCGFGSNSFVTVTIAPLQATLAGTAGGATVCTTSSVYSEFAGAATIYSDGTCSPIAAVTPSGASPVSGAIQSCVTVDAGVQSFNGIPYVPRYYSLEPTSNASTSTATVTLYFTQADFDAYNAARGSNPALPTGPADATGISNLHITQFHGTGTTPDTYVGGSGDIVPNAGNVVWNAGASRWEVTFNITGFSGFFASGGPIVTLPLTLTDFSGRATLAGNVLDWTTVIEENTNYFEVQRAVDGAAGFADLAKVTAAGNSQQTLQYSYDDVMKGDSHPAYSYRLKMTDLDGKFTYSKIVTLQPLISGLSVRVSPNPFVQPLSLIVFAPAVAPAVLTVTDMSGKKLIVKALTLQKGENSLDAGMLAGLSQGLYFIHVATDTQQQTIKFVKE